MRITLRLTGRQHGELRKHLYRGDGREAVSLALCGRRVANGEQTLLVHQLVHVPLDQCAVRTPTRITWTTDLVGPLIEEAGSKGLALLKVHSHQIGRAHV